MELKSKAIPSPCPELNTVLGELVDSIPKILGANFVGSYLQGSFAVGDFDVHSDVDFIIVAQEELSEEQVQAVQAMHERIYCLDIPWAQHLEGSYFPKEILRDCDHSGKLLWYLDHGSRSLIKADHCNTVVVRWVVHEYGIALAGPPPGSLVDPIPVERLRREIMRTITGWGQELIDNPDRFANRFYQSFIVLNFCRMLHDLHRGFPGSKLAGAEWAKAKLDPSWQGLIDRTWNGRPNPAISVRQQADPRDFEDTLKFVQYIINESTLLYPTLN